MRTGPRNFLDRASGKKRLLTFKGQQEERAVRQLGEGRLAVGANEKVRWADEVA